MNILDINDGEYANFLQEMQEDAAAKWPELAAQSRPKAVLLMPGECRIDIKSVRKMVRDRNIMVDLLNEFLALHPEETKLTKRARRFTGHSPQRDNPK